MFLFLISSVSALAISSSYWSGLRLSPGETKEIYLTLQNIVGQEDLYIQGNILNGSEIVKLSDSNTLYSVPLGSKTKVNMTITIPEDAKLGDKYLIDLSFTTVKVGGAGAFGFGSSIGQKINVIIGSDSEIKTKQTTQTIYIVIGIVILLAIIIFVAKKKKLI